MATIQLTINGKACEAPKGSTILKAAQANGIRIPTLCYLDKVHQFGACRRGGRRTQPAGILHGGSAGRHGYPYQQQARA